MGFWAKMASLFAFWGKNISKMNPNPNREKEEGGKMRRKKKERKRRRREKGRQSTRRRGARGGPSKPGAGGTG